MQGKYPATAEYAPLDNAGRSQEAALQQLAEKSPKAAYDLGLRYFRGDGVRQNSYQSMRWLRRAAEAGDVQAQRALGSIYLLGLEEMGADPQAAEKWFRLAADQADEEALRLLPSAQEAVRAQRQSSEAYYQWQLRWRELYVKSLSSGYRYYGYWKNDSWQGY